MKTAVYFYTAATHENTKKKQRASYLFFLSKSFGLGINPLK